jgi:hypothetical protein
MSPGLSIFCLDSPFFMCQIYINHLIKYDYLLGKRNMTITHSRISVKKNNHSLFGKAHYSLKDDNINLNIYSILFDKNKTILTLNIIKHKHIKFSHPLLQRWNTIIVALNTNPSKSITWKTNIFHVKQINNKICSCQFIIK